MKSKENSLPPIRNYLSQLSSVFMHSFYPNNRKNKAGDEAKICPSGMDPLSFKIFLFLLVPALFFRLLQLLVILQHYPWNRDFKEIEKMRMETKQIKELIRWNDHYQKVILNKIHPQNFIAALCFSSVPGLQIEQLNIDFPENNPRASCTLRVIAEEPAGIETLGFYCAFASLAFEKSTGKKLKFEYADISLPKEKESPLQAVISCSPLKEDLQ